MGTGAERVNFWVRVLVNPKLLTVHWALAVHAIKNYLSCGFPVSDLFSIPGAQDHARQLRLLKDAHLKTSAHVESEQAAALEKAAQRLARVQGDLEEERAAAARAIENVRAHAEQEVAALKEEHDAEKARARAQVEDARRLAEEARRDAEERKIQQVRR